MQQVELLILDDMFFNFPLVASIIAMVVGQLVKLPIHYFLHKEYMPRILFSTGGMPSSHSAFVTALVISIGIKHGVNTTEFAIAFVLAGVVIHDAMGIRREAGKHATVLNRMGEDIRDIVGKEYNHNFKELLGHKPSEALAGILLGVITSLLCYYLQ